jgi:septation ring formation regulator EzrA
MSKIHTIFCFALALVLHCGFAQDDGATKVQAYRLAVQTIPRLEEQLVAVQKAIDQITDKIRKFQVQIDEGITSSNSLLEIYKKQQDALEESKDKVEGKLKLLKEVIEQLKKDPEVGAEIRAEEGLREMSSKLREAEAILQTTP